MPTFAAISLINMSSNESLSNTLEKIVVMECSYGGKNLHSIIQSNFTEVIMQVNSFLKIWLLSVNFEKFASKSESDKSQLGVWRAVVGRSSDL